MQSSGRFPGQPSLCPGPRDLSSDILLQLLSDFLVGLSFWRAEVCRVVTASPSVRKSSGCYARFLIHSRAEEAGYLFWALIVLECAELSSPAGKEIPGILEGRAWLLLGQPRRLPTLRTSPLPRPSGLWAWKSVPQEAALVRKSCAPEGAHCSAPQGWEFPWAENFSALSLFHL